MLYRFYDQLQQRLLRVYNGTEGTLVSALADEDSAEVKQLLADGADPNGLDKDGRR